MVLIRSAVNLLNQRITGVMDDYDTICPATRIMSRWDWVLFLQRESQRTGEHNVLQHVPTMTPTTTLVTIPTILSRKEKRK
ncbi:hypothetical protein BC941DRAFT_475522 [Chlamydoabsidia padenii]|nr:hypothetical protein BC941DRAFT_475522 [Chlamydoabsidia padenii]